MTRQNDKELPICCMIDCDTSAAFEVRDGLAAADYTHACAEHVGALLDPSKVSAVYEAPEAAIR